MNHSKPALSALLTLTFTLIVSLVACVEPESDEPTEAQQLDAIEHTLIDYLDCTSSGDECVSEEHELTTTLQSLDDAGFRAGSVADCGGGSTVSCRGQKCVASDGVGCACITNGKLASFETCPE